MQTVWKFAFGHEKDARFVIEVPEGAVPLCVDFDPQGVLVVWARVDTDAALTTAVVTVVATGRPLPEDAGSYISTFRSEHLVFHSFWR